MFLVSGKGAGLGVVAGLQMECMDGTYVAVEWAEDLMHFDLFVEFE